MLINVDICIIVVGKHQRHATNRFGVNNSRHSEYTELSEIAQLYHTTDVCYFYSMGTSTWNFQALSI